MGIDLGDAFNRITSSGKYGKFKQKGSIAENINPWGKDTSEFQSGMVNPFAGKGESSNEAMGSALKEGKFERAHDIFGTGPQNVIGQGNYREKRHQGWDQEKSFQQADDTSATSAAAIMSLIAGGNALAKGGESAGSGAVKEGGTEVAKSGFDKVMDKVNSVKQYTDLIPGSEGGSQAPARVPKQSSFQRKEAARRAAMKQLAMQQNLALMKGDR